MRNAAIRSRKMKAVILAAGRGTRMRDLTKELPKPMLKVKGKPILEHIIDGLKSTGILEFCIITGFRADVVEGYFSAGAQLGVSIQYVRQTVQDGTGKAPELAKEFVGNDPFLLTYGDILVKPETYQQMVDRYTSADFDGVITVTPGQDVTKGGINFFDANFCLKRVVEKPTPEQVKKYQEEGLIVPNQPVWYNAGIYIFKPLLFQFTSKLQKSPRGEYELTDAVNQIVEAGFKLAGLRIAGRWVDVRDPDVLSSLEAESDGQ